MKKLFVMLGAFFLMCGIGFSQEIKFNETVCDFGEVIINGDASCEFSFENTGSEPLMLTNLQPSIGSILVEGPMEPIAPGQTGKIKVMYKDTQKPGAFTETVTVFSNALENKEVKLTIMGIVSEENE